MTKTELEDLNMNKETKIVVLRDDLDSNAHVLDDLQNGLKDIANNQRLSLFNQEEIEENINFLNYVVEELEKRFDLLTAELSK